MTGHRALEKKQITQGNNRKVQNPSGSRKGLRKSLSYIKPLFSPIFFHQTFFTTNILLFLVKNFVFTKKLHNFAPDFCLLKGENLL